MAVFSKSPNGLSASYALLGEYISEFPEAQEVLK